MNDYFDDDPAAWQGSTDPETWRDILADRDGPGRVSDEAFNDFVSGDGIPE